MSDIIFLHGLESGPKGAKFHALEAAGFRVTSPDMRERMLAERVAMATALLRERPGLVVVGSSYGGLTGLHAVALAADAGAAPKALLLLAPALGLVEPPVTDREVGPVVPTRILHGTGDEICPISISRAFAEAHPELVRLEEVEDTHRLAASLPRIVAMVRELCAPG